MRERLITRKSSRWYNYLLYLPDNYLKEKLPLMLFLHGAGEKGNHLEKVKMQGPPKLIEEGREFPFIVVSPQCPVYSYWYPDPLKMLLEEVTEETNADRERIYVTGISMGGYGIWSLVSKYPDTFAAAIPICGGGDETRVGRMKDVPTWVFHGAQDNIVPLSESEVMVNALMAAGGNVKLTVYPDANHDSWTRTYNNPEIYEWLLKHRRTGSRVETL